MMGSIEAWVCDNAWWESITAYPEGDWCGADGGFTYSGFWQITGMASSSECWVCALISYVVNICLRHISCTGRAAVFERANWMG
jgi:hypothetical protein